MATEFFIIGITLVIGFAAAFFFDKTRISEVILLMLFGFLLGPVFGLLDVSAGSVIVSILPFVGSLALIVLLFDGGMEFDIFGLAKAIPKSMLFTLIVFILSVLIVTAFTSLLLSWPLLHGALLGATIGGISSAVVITMVEKTGLKKETKSLLTVESTLTDALCIITAVIIVEIIIGGSAPELGSAASLLLSQFTIAIMLGIVAAGIWIMIIDRFALHNYAYMLMLALVFILFSVTEEVRGSGGIAVFTFGIILGNASKIGKMAKVHWQNPVNRMMRLFQDEVTFFVRTFFFVYIGLLLSLEYFTPTVMAISIAITALLILPRMAAKKLILPDLPKRDSNVTMTMMPRGLAAAVLATLPLTRGLMIGNFQELVFAVLLLSNVAATIGIYLFDKEEKK